MLVYIAMASKVIRLALAGRTSLSISCFKVNKSLKYNGWLVTMGFQSLFEPFPEGMDKERALVDFYGEIKISKGIFKILLDPVSYIVSGVLRKVIA